MPQLKTAKSPTADQTALRILAAAEKIFARGGYRAMTLREVTREAKVNLAAVNYHFGSKSNLMRAIIRERFEPINVERLRLLDQSIQAHSPAPVPLAEIFDALLRPMFFFGNNSSKGGPSLTQIIGRALAEPADLLRNLHREFFEELSRRFMAELRRSCPDLDETTLQYRFFLSINTMIGTFIDQVCLEAISGGKLSHVDSDRMLRELTDFTVAGFQQG
ncbi:MAG: TetR family transcriptional regulator [Verrucomicrobia bacterium]|jgi:AcrR family transcriptional regulator|nr:TetR family transcriptional regulator [Verrucomicrobiota bacterium]